MGAIEVETLSHDCCYYCKHYEEHQGEGLDPDWFACRLSGEDDDLNFLNQPALTVCKMFERIKTFDMNRPAYRLHVSGI